MFVGAFEATLHSFYTILSGTSPIRRDASRYVSRGRSWGSFTERVGVGQRDVPGVVNALTTAVRTNVDQLVADMERELEGSAAPAVERVTK